MYASLEATSSAPSPFVFLPGVPLGESNDAEVDKDTSTVYQSLHYGNAAEDTSTLNVESAGYTSVRAPVSIENSLYVQHQSTKYANPAPTAASSAPSDTYANAGRDAESAYSAQITAQDDDDLDDLYKSLEETLDAAHSHAT